MLLLHTDLCRCCTTYKSAAVSTAQFAAVICHCTANANACAQKSGHGAEAQQIRFSLLVQLWDCSVQSNQRWWKDADGALRPMHAPQFCLEVASGNIRTGTSLQVKLMAGTC
jgi:hypothetical protein